MHFLKKMMIATIMLIAGLSNEGWCTAGLQRLYPVEFPEPIANVQVGHGMPGIALPFGCLPTPGHSGIVNATNNNPNPIFPNKNIPLANDGDRFTWIQVPNANNADIYFPIDGCQPTTQKAAEWSCANVFDAGPGTHGRAVTEWYMRMFGWTDPTVRGQVPLQMGFAPLGPRVDIPTPQDPKEIITLGASMGAQNTNIPNPARGGSFNREEAFWHTFRQIASKPVGRVLLYRLLIEIRREDPQNMNGICENNIIHHIRQRKLLRNRNQCRSIYISNNTDNGFSFCRGEERCIEFDFHDMKTYTLKINANHTIDIGKDGDTLDIGLFHEMLHWFHYLRNPKRFDDSNAKNPRVYKYALRSYYGDPSELCTWGSAVDEEEIRVILGTPDYRKIAHFNLIPQEAFFLTVNPGNGVIVGNGFFIPFESRFLEGDDLSENAYRMSVLDPNGRICRMRFGHGRNINPVPIPMQIVIPNRFRLAYLVATDCYREITGQPVQNWDLVNGQAAQ